MRAVPVCPRCGAIVRPPSPWSSTWTCAEHGSVAPLHPAGRPGQDALDHLRRQAARGQLPVWLPWPLPNGWLVSGCTYAGEDRTGAAATVVALCGPGPLGGAAEWFLVAESPGVGLGAWLAGLPGPDPGRGFDAGPPHAKVEAAGHPTPLWGIPGDPGVAAFVGEARAAWLWALLWPASAGVLLLEAHHLVDLVERTDGLDIPHGALAPHLAALAR